jgi:hypothetical protein
MSWTRFTSSCAVMAFLMEVRGAGAPLLPLLVLVARGMEIWGVPLLPLLVLVACTWV